MKRFWIMAGLVLIGAFSLHAAVTPIIEIVNTLSIARPDAMVVWTRPELEKRVGDIGKGKYVQMSGVSGQPVLIQFDDLNGDGEWDEAVIVHTFAAHEKLQLSVSVSDAPAAIKAVVRAHVRMKEKGAGDVFGPDLDSVVMPPHNPPTDFSKEKLPRWLTEGPGWENDKVAYRLYFDTRNGKDIYGKRLPGMVMEWVGADTATSYHELADWGMDVLKVGSSLGAGALALSMPVKGKRDTLVRLGGAGIRREVYRKVADGPLRAIFSMEYEWEVLGHDIKIVEETTIPAGQYYYESKVTVTGAPAGSRLVTGIANFYTNEPGNFTKDDAMVLYSHGRQSENKDMMGMALLTSQKDFSSFRSLPASGGEINSTYAVSQKIGDRALYFRFYTGWEKTNARFATLSYFKKLLEEEAVRFSHRLDEKWSMDGADRTKPNIVMIYADDLGYGDLGCYGATRVKTPNLDLLASRGLRFRDAHCTAATCTPSRVSLLTGSYAFRNDAAILPGDAPLLIRPGTVTLPSMLQRAGYTTAVIGKWHLGLGDGVIDWNRHIAPGPAEVGFGYSFIIPATLDRVPTVYVENQDVVNLDPLDPIVVSYAHPVGNDPTGSEHPEMLKYRGDPQHSNTIVDSISRIGYMSGGHAARWKDEEMANVLLDRTREFLREQIANGRRAIDRGQTARPFFLYLAYTDIHVPRDPNPRFKGLSAMGRRGDAIAQLDWLTGHVIGLLQAQGLDSNTLIIFSSDNGPVLDDGYDDQAVGLAGTHRPGGPYKGGKYSAYEAGTRVPTIVYWPGHVKPGVSDALVNQVDLLASMARLAGQALPMAAAPDSYDMLDAWLGKSAKGRDVMLEESFTLALRQGKWKYIAPQTKAGPAWMANKRIATGLGPKGQLYDLSTDRAERKDLAAAQPERAAAMHRMIEKIRAGASRPGSTGGDSAVKN